MLPQCHTLRASLGVVCRRAGRRNDPAQVGAGVRQSWLVVPARGRLARCVRVAGARRAPWQGGLRALLAGAVLLAGAGAGAAQTWTGAVSGDWNDPGNWTPAAVPAATAAFSASNPNVPIGFSHAVTNIGTLAFDPTAPQFLFSVGNVLNIKGAGIVNNSAVAPEFDVAGTLKFLNGSTAGNASIVDCGCGGRTIFADSSTAGNATIFNDGGTTVFKATSSAGHANITNVGPGSTSFFDHSTAANAVITNAVFGQTNFFDHSTADGAFIINVVAGATNFFNNSTAGGASILNQGGTTNFFDHATAGNATIANSGEVLFSGHSTAGNAVITNIFGATGFANHSSAGNATIANGLNGLTLFFDHSTAGAAAITNDNGGATIFNNHSKAGTAAIVNNDGGATMFYDHSRAGHAVIADNSGGGTAFFDRSSGGHATFLNSGLLFFYDRSTAGHARLVNDAGGVVDFSGTTGRHNDGRVSAGSIEGAGTYFLGANQLAVGANNLSTTVSGVIADGGAAGGTGASLVKVGTGTLTLAGANTYTGGTTISAGTLQLGDGGSINGDVLNNATFAVNRSDIFAFNGAISGNGAFVQAGSGMTILTGVSTYTGPTQVNAGILSVDGSLVSTVFVNAGGALIGNGTIGGLEVMSGGIVAPGHSVGTLNVNGNVSFGPGSVYLVDANAAGQADKILASGNAALAGGTVQVLAQFGNFLPSTTYTILTANGGVAGAFDKVVDNFAFLTPSLTYTPTSVLLTLDRNAFFVSQAQTPNQHGAAAALDASSLTSPLVLAVLFQSAGGAQQAFDALSGEIYGSVQTVLLDESFLVRQEILTRLRQAAYAGAPGELGALRFGGQQTTSDGPELAYAQAPAMPLKAMPAAAAAGSDWTVWAKALGGWGRADGDGNAAAAKSSFGGFLAGADTRFGEMLRLGVVAGYTFSSLAIDAQASGAGIETAHAGAYAGAKLGDLSLRAGAAYSFHAIDTSRTVMFPGFLDHTLGRFDGSTAQVFSEVGYGIAFGRLAVEPFAGAAFVHLNTDGLLETGGLAALSVGGASQDVGYSSLGVRAATMILLDNGHWLVPRAAIAWQHAVDGVTPAAALAFQSTGAAFSTAGVPIARDAALAEAGFDVRFSARAKMSLAYTGMLAEHAQTHSVKGGFTWNY
jgi:outer membrane autotransporter protein